MGVLTKSIVRVNILYIQKGKMGLFIGEVVIRELGVGKHHNLQDDGHHVSVEGQDVQDGAILLHLQVAFLCVPILG